MYHDTLLLKEVVVLRWPKNLRWKIPLFVLYGCLLAVWLWRDLPCVIRFLSGVICPGCGMSRAWLAFFRLDLSAAFSYHPMFWSVPVLALYLLYDGALFQNRRLNNWVLGMILGAFALCYIIRLIVCLGGNLTV